VVSKALNIVEAEVAIFGNKDQRQMLIARWVVWQLALVAIETGEASRVPDGLARPARNSHLSREQRWQALALFREFAPDRASCTRW